VKIVDVDGLAPEVLEAGRDLIFGGARREGVGAGDEILGFRIPVAIKRW
jgi:hypothetical protein